MEPETQKKIEETVLEILKSSNMAETNEYNVRKMASEKLGLDLSAPEHKQIVKQVLETYLKGEPGLDEDDDNNVVKSTEDDEEEPEEEVDDDEEQRRGREMKSTMDDDDLYLS